MGMYTSFLDEEGPTDERNVDKAALEIRAMALVLSGAIPPYIVLAECANSVELVLNNPASLLPSKGTDDGV